MSNSTYDAIIIGCGIGGGALATVLGRAGKSVLVLEKATVYRDRVRGEWIAPWGGLRIENGYLLTAKGAEPLHQTPYLIHK